MTRKDYIALAIAFSKAHPPAGSTANPVNTWLNCINRVCDVLAEDNPSFDKAHFVSLCVLPFTER